jgi:hypothetical protein
MRSVSIPANRCLFPAGPDVALAPKRVLAAWDSQIEASRAVRESLDLLVSADEVRLALVDPVPGKRHGPVPTRGVPDAARRQSGC